MALASPALDTHDYMRLVGHTGAVLALTVCPYTARLYTSSVDCSVRVGADAGARVGADSLHELACTAIT